MNIFLKLLLLIIAVFVLCCLFFYFTKTVGSKVCFGSNCFLVELATTPAQQEQGLMFRKTLDENKGMLFIFPNEADYAFWMKNTLIPLDMIWIRKNPSASSGQVVYMAENVQPCPPRLGEAGKVENCPVINPGVPAEYVLEINAGISKKIGLKIGDEFTFTY